MSLYRTLGASAVGGGIGAASADNKEDALRRGVGGALLAGGAVQFAKAMKGSPALDKNLGVPAPSSAKTPNVKTPDLKTTGVSPDKISPDKISPDIKVPDLKQPKQKLLTSGKETITSAAEDTTEYVDKAMRSRLKEQMPGASQKEIDDMVKQIKASQAETKAHKARVNSGLESGMDAEERAKTLGALGGKDPFKGMTTKAEAKKTYRKLMMKHHPDQNPDDLAGAQSRSAAITKLYGMLKEASLYENPTLHFFYDELLRNGVY